MRRPLSVEIQVGAKGKALGQNPFLSIDLLADSRSVAYFAMKDALIHCFSLQSVEYRRDFNLEVAAALDRFAALPKNVRKALHEAYTMGFERPSNSPSCRRPNDLRDVILNRVPFAKNFFGKNDLTDTATLKSAYRRQSKKYHPDVGGSNEEMLLLNDAFNAIFENIASGSADILPFGRREGKFSAPVEWVEIDRTPIPKSTWCGWLGPLVCGTFSGGVRVFRALDAERAMTLLRASIAIEEYELLGAVGLMRNLLSKKLNNTQRDFGWNAAAIEASIQLCKQLRASQLDAEAEEITHLLGSSNLKSHQYWSHQSKELDSIMLPDVRPKVNPLYPRHRANWERYLPPRKTGTAERLLAARQARDTQFHEAVSALGGFINLTHDPSKLQTSSSILKNIPQPNPWAAINPEQALEYHSAFYLGPSLDLVRKHLSLRCDMWFCALFDPNVNIASLLVEIKTVAKFIPQTLQRTPVRQLIDSLVPRFTFMDFVDFLFALAPGEARQRLDLLTAIDFRHAAPIRDWVANHTLQNSFVIGSGISFRDISFPDVRDTFYREKPEQLSLSGQLTLNPILVRSWRKEWFKAACSPMGQLESTFATGWMNERELAVETAWRRCRDYSTMSALTQELWWATGARQALEDEKDELFISIAKKSLDICLKHVAQTEFVEELQLGWWSEALAKAYLRIGDRNSACQLAQQFFSLPERTRAWTSEEQLKALGKLCASSPKE